MYKQFKYPGKMILAVSTLLLAFGTGKQEGEMKPSLSGATGWLNTQPLSLDSLRGKVVLIDFWTYTCINWRRTLPYVREWAQRYKDHGLVVIGVHTPEFKFEYELENVSRSVKEMNIAFPVALDNNYEIWRSFQNEYWPALYLIDAKGKLRYQKFGESDYQEPEKMIQRLLKANKADVPDGAGVPVAEGVEVAADWANLQSAENFLGYNRTVGFASPGGLITDKPATYSIPDRLKLNQWAISGDWIMGKEHILLTKAGGKISYRFHARDLHLIMGPAKKGTSIKFRVLIDGKPPGQDHGTDVDPDGNGTVKDQRMYHLIRQQRPVMEKVIEIEFSDSEVEVYDFTFG